MTWCYHPEDNYNEYLWFQKAHISCTGQCLQVETFPHSTVALTELKLVNQTAVFWWVVMLCHLRHRHYIAEESVASIFGVEDCGNRFL